MDKKPVVYCLFCRLTVAPYADQVCYGKDMVAHQSCFRAELKKRDINPKPKRVNEFDGLDDFDDEC